MLRSMTIHQWQEWKLYAEMEPFGEDREDARTGMIVQVLANAHRDSKRRRKPYSLEECVPVPSGDAFGPRVGRKSWQDLKATAMMIAAFKSED
jgi:hypothetical protein